MIIIEFVDSTAVVVPTIPQSVPCLAKSALGVKFNFGNPLQKPYFENVIKDLKEIIDFQIKIIIKALKHCLPKNRF